MKYAQVAENVKKLVENRACELGWSLRQHRSGNPPPKGEFIVELLPAYDTPRATIFLENAVSNAIASHTADDGSDLDAFFKQLFDWLDTSDAERGINREGSQGTQEKNVGQASCLSADEESLRSLRSFAVTSLPYVNGALFRDHYDIPSFSAKSRRMLIQAVIDPEERNNLEMAA
jgi:hypothetical protein